LIVSNYVLIYVYKDIVSGKTFSSREAPTARKRRYIKGFRLSHGKNITVLQSRKTAPIAPRITALPRSLSFQTPRAILSNEAPYYQTEGRKRTPPAPPRNFPKAVRHGRAWRQKRLPKNLKPTQNFPCIFPQSVLWYLRTIPRAPHSLHKVYTKGLDFRASAWYNY